VSTVGGGGGAPAVEAEAEVVLVAASSDEGGGYSRGRRRWRQRRRAEAAVEMEMEMEAEAVGAEASVQTEAGGGGVGDGGARGSVRRDGDHPRGREIDPSPRPKSLRATSICSSGRPSSDARWWWRSRSRRESRGGVSRSQRLASTASRAGP
jgi:hypothetical protein